MKLKQTPSFCCQVLNYGREHYVLFSTKTLAINHITSQYTAFAVVSSCGIHQEDEQSSDKAWHFPVSPSFRSWGLQPSALSDPGEKGGDEIDQFFCDIVDSCNFWMILCIIFWIMLVIWKNLQDTGYPVSYNT